MRNQWCSFGVVVLVFCPMAFGQVEGDVNLDGANDAVDVQVVINDVLGLNSDSFADLNCSDTTDAVDVQLVILTVLGLPAAVCDTGIAGFPGQLPLGQDPDPAQVTGYVYDDSGLIIIDGPASAPNGSTPVDGATVTLTNEGDEQIASTTTDSAGAFAFDDVPYGVAKVQATSPLKGVSMTTEVSVYAGASIAVGETYPITREQATTTALQSASPNALTIGTLQPLAAGTRVHPVGLDDPDNHPSARTLSAPAWFFLVEEGPTQRWPHEVTYVFIDAQTGDADVIRPVYMPPRINDGAIWDGEEYVTYDVDIGAIEPGMDLPDSIGINIGAEIIQQAGTGPKHVQVRWDPPAINDDLLKNHNASLDSLFLLILIGHEGSDGTNDMLRMYKLFVSAGVPLPNIRIVDTTKYNPRQGLDKYKADLAALNAKIQERLDQGLHSTLFFYYSGHGAIQEAERGTNMFIPTGRIVPHFAGDRWILWTAKTLNLKSTPACELRCILDTCYSKYFGININNNINELPASDRPDLLIYASADVDQISYFYSVWRAVASFQTPGGVFTTAFLNKATITSGEIAGVLNAQQNAYTFTLPDQTPGILLQPNVPTRCTTQQISSCDLMGNFTEGLSECRTANDFSDYFTITIDDGTFMTIDQPSTSDVNTGFIAEDGTFEVMRADGNEMYFGTFDVNTCTGTATNFYTDSEGCQLQYSVEFVPMLQR